MMTLCMVKDLLHEFRFDDGTPPPVYPPVGIITEDGSAWITTEDGTILRTEDQPQTP